MKYAPLVIIVCIALIGCKKRDAAFSAAAKDVATVTYVTVPGSTALADVVNDRGGFPPTSISSTVPKAGDIQFVVGYTAKGDPVVVVVVKTDGTSETVTDSDLVQAYAKKAHTSKTTGSEAAGSAPAANGGGDAHSVPKGCPVRIGMSKEAVQKRLGPPTSTNSNSNGTQICIYQPFDPQASAETEAAGRGLSMLGAFGDLAPVRRSVGSRLHHESTYAVTFTGGTVSSVQVDN